VSTDLDVDDVGGIRQALECRGRACVPAGVARPVHALLGGVEVVR
jgi:hypothetical protein